MTKRATVDDFPIGATVRLMRHPRHRPQYAEYLYHPATVIATDTAGRGWVRVSYGPRTSLISWRPWWLERGRVEWIPEVTE